MMSIPAATLELFRGRTQRCSWVGTVVRNGSGPRRVHNSRLASRLMICEVRLKRERQALDRQNARTDRCADFYDGLAGE
ncbi:hypothetical protein D3C80_673030 [compost metagenome]